MNHIKIANLMWRDHIETLRKKYPKRPLCLVDATCGNGHDSIFLSKFHNRVLHCIDIQEISIENTKIALKNEENTYFHHTSHSTLDYIEEPIDLIVYNLGYLPGSDKSIITNSITTTSSLEKALERLSNQGMISITIYTGHDGGQDEEKAILTLIKTIPTNFKIIKTSFLQKKHHPYAIFIKKLF